MALYKIILCLIFSSQVALSANPLSLERQILYSMHTGDIAAALQVYKTHKGEGRHDMELLQQIGLMILDKGFRSKDPKTQLMTLLGAGISSHERALYILEEGVLSGNPELQLVALNYLSRFHNDRADAALNKALGSDHLVVRFEVLHHLAEKKDPKAVWQLEALMAKVDKRLHPLFPQLFALVGNAMAIKIMKKQLTSPDEKVRIAAILSAADYNRDDLLPQIRKASLQHSQQQQEAAAIALGILHDEYSMDRLKVLTKSSSPFTRLAALQSLCRLGKKEYLYAIEKMAKEGNLFAIAMLDEMQESKETLLELSKSPQLNIRINASLALLELRDEKCVRPLMEILLHDMRDLIFVKTTTPAGGLFAWKAVPSASHNLKDEPVAFEVSLLFREDVLIKTLELPPAIFLQIADALFETHQNELVPTLCDLLENMRSKEAIALLKKHAQKLGAPLIRTYCSLALFNIKEEGPYEENLRLWITKQQEEDLIRLRPYVPWEIREKDAAYLLTPHETSKLLIKGFESFARSQDDRGLSVLIEALENGNPLNRFALAGLLIRAAM